MPEHVAAPTLARLNQPYPSAVSSLSQFPLRAHRPEPSEPPSPQSPPPSPPGEPDTVPNSPTPDPIEPVAPPIGDPPQPTQAPQACVRGRAILQL